MKLQKAFLLLFLCLGELTLLSVEGRGAVGKGSSGRSFKGRTGGRGGTGRGDLDPFNSLSNLHWWQVEVNLKQLLLVLVVVQWQLREILLISGLAGVWSSRLRNRQLPGPVLL